MRIPLLSRRRPTLDRRGPGDPMPPLPEEPLYVFEFRGDDLPSPPSNSDGEGLDLPAPPRPTPRPPSLRTGSVVLGRPRGDATPAQLTEDQMRAVAIEVAAEMVPNRLMDAVSAGPRETSSPALGWSLQMNPFGMPYPSRSYAVRDIRGLRWERFNGRGFWQLRFDEGVVAEELPAWLAFGPAGEHVAEILEQVAALAPEQVRALPVPAGTGRFRIPVELVEDPVGHPLRDAARRASSTAMVWTESRGWAVDPGAGGHYYRGCYFVYNLSEPHWLSAMGRAMNAAILAALGGQSAHAPRVRSEWAELSL